MGANGVRLGADGRLQVVRSAPPEDADHLRRVVARLRAAAGPGVVQVLSHDDDGERVEVVLAFAGRPPTAPVRADELTPIAASVASHLADLHLRGIAHGAIAPSHVLVDAAGAVRLCGLAGGDPGDDVAAFGRLVDALLDPDDTSGAAAALWSLSARCAVDETSARPSMAAIAAAIATTSPRRRAVTVDRAPARGRRRTLSLAFGAVVAVVVALVAVASVRRADAPGDERASAGADATTITTTAPIVAARIWPPSPPQTFERDGEVWSFGVVGDEIRVADWDCDGVDTPALVDRSGRIFIVDDWPDGDELVSRYVATVDGALAVDVERGLSCDRLRIRTADGQVVTPALRA